MGVMHLWGKGIESAIQYPVASISDRLLSTLSPLSLLICPSIGGGIDRLAELGPVTLLSRTNTSRLGDPPTVYI